MSIALIYETQNEVRRLLIAGSNLASGDFRLTKLLPKMQLSGKAAPIFARVAEAIEKVVEQENGSSAENLLELANLVNAIIYTQGETGASGGMAKVDTVALNLGTTASYRKINPVIEALTTKGSGRYEIIKNAADTDSLKDLRLVNPLLTALGDGYSEIADLAFAILKRYGTAISPLLKKKIDFSGGKIAARMLELLAFVEGEACKDIYLEALENGCLEVRVQAVYALQGIKECESVLLNLASDRKKEVREAALTSLSGVASDSAATRLIESFKGKDREIAKTPIKRCHSRLLTELLVKEGEFVLEAVLSTAAPETKENDNGTNAKCVDVLYDIFECMEEKTDQAVVSFLQKSIAYTEHLAKFKHAEYSYYNRVESTLAKAAAKALLTGNTKQGLAFLVELEGGWQNHLLAYSFEAALLSCSPDYVFETFAKFTVNRKNAAFQELIPIFKRLAGISGYYYNHEAESHDIKLHDGWMEIFAEAKETELVCQYITEGNSAGIAYLLKCLKGKQIQWYKYRMIFEGLLRAKYDQIQEVMVQELTKVLDQKDPNKYYMRQILELTKGFGKGFADELEKLTANCRDKDSSEMLLATAHDLKMEGRNNDDN